MKNILIGMAIGVVVAVGIMCFYNFNQKCASNNIEFAERVASRIIDDLGDRTWFVTDGTLDKYLLRVAAERNKELNLICLNLDHDKDYVDALRQLVHHKKPGGNKNGELLLSLDSGVLSFIRHWLLTDSQIAKKLAIFGVPDLWCSAGIDPVPESFFFGGDPSRKVDMSLWKDFKGLLFEPKEWGSNSLGNKDDSVEYLRFQIRRHLGFVANNKGVYLQKAGNDGDAYKMYDLVLSEIDSDNISALINIFEMISRKHPSAVIRKKEILNRIKLALDEDNRYRWRKWSLSRYYGYISNPERFAKMGYAWARSGCMRDSMFLGQINRAESLVSLDDNMLHNDMLLAILSANNKYSSRQICQSILRRNPEDYNALLDMVGFELRDGNKMKAIEYLERVTKYSTDWLEATIELSIIALLKNNYDEAEKILEDAISYSSNNMKAWALLATVKMHRYNATKDKKTKNSILNNIETGILSKMKAYTKNHLDYYLLVTRAFFFTVKGETKHREACESFVKAVEKRSNCDVIYDLILKHSILLNDVKNGEFAASNIHQDNRKSPLASYVLGLAALQRGDSKSAEIFLRESADVFSHNGLVLNDLAEALRRNKKYSEAEHYALMAVHNDPRFYLPWVTLGSILMERKKEIEEAHKCIMKGYELSKKEKRMVTVNVLLSFINDYLKNSDKDNIVITIRKIQSLVYGSSKYDKL